MNVLPLRLLSTDPPAVAAAENRVARIEVFDDLTSAEPYWRALENGCVLGTPYQHFDFLQLWHRHVGVPARVAPFVVVGFNCFGAPLFVWPLGLRRVLGLRVVEFLGGKHANFNMGLWRSEFAAGLTAADLWELLARLSARADVLKFCNQPLTWGGSTNPFALLPHQRAANYGFSGALASDFEGLLRARTNAQTRKKMRKKERALTNYGPVRFEMVEDGRTARRVLDTFFKQKSARMRAQGLRDVFGEADVRRFVEAAAGTRAADGAPLIELYALHVGDMIVATLGGIIGRGRFCAMFNSITQDRYAAESPGEQLLLNVVRHCCERGIQSFDLGIGEARYKNLFCPDAEPLFDSYLALGRAGWLPVRLYRIAAAAKRGIKQRVMLWRLVRAARRLRARFSQTMA